MRPFAIAVLASWTGLAWAQEAAPQPAAPPAESSAPAGEPPAETAPDGGATSSPREAGTIPVRERKKPESRPRSDATELDTITVTAEKRATTQRDIPASVGALRGDDLEKMKAQSLSDYLKLIPGVSMADYGNGESIPVIRGIASDTAGIGQQLTALTTGIFVDEMPFSDLFLPGSVPDLNPFDLERVEVLKGPQGTLFGSGALAGAIRYILHKPDHSLWEAKASQTFTQTRFGGTSPTTALALNAPLFGDAIAVRAAGVYRTEHGFYDAVPYNPDGRPDGGNTRDEQDIDRLHQVSGRGLISWHATDRLDVSGFWFGQNNDTTDEGWADNPTTPTRGITPFAAPTLSRFGGGNATATYDFDALRLTYSANYLQKHTQHNSRNEPATQQTAGQRQNAWYNYFSGRVTGYTHELRVSPAAGNTSDWDWLGGVAYFKYHQGFFQFTPVPGTVDQPVYRDPPHQASDVSRADRQTSYLFAVVNGLAEESALFGEATRHFGEHFEATLGARAFKTDLLTHAYLTGAQIEALTTSTEARDTEDAREQGINPKVSLRYVHDSHIQAYVLAAKGFQFGGFQLNPELIGVSQNAQAQGFAFGPYKSSKLWNYELGVRTEWLDRRLRFDTTFFYLDWRDLQLQLAIPINAIPLPFPEATGLPKNVSEGVIVNVGRAHSAGVEMQLQVIPFDGATWTSSAAWMNAMTDVEFDSANSEGPVPAGTRLPGSPHFQWSNVAGYEHSLPFFERWVAGPVLTHAHIGTSPNGIRSSGEVGGYDTFDARIAFAEPSSRYQPELSIGMNNLTDVRGIAGSYIASPIFQYYFIAPRTTVLSLSLKY
ncbi:MAG TPA: TonB-dependent receptor plug domain-containing protein [Candidatus Binatia bacterium]|nr:TonB-dependent receptor plug domain-containing protein [Candidatus Binatia bacterium]